MKKIIFTILMLLILVSLLTTSAFAAEEGKTETKFDIEEYLTEKIAPICVGVATSLVALIGTIGKVRTSASSITSAERVIKEVKESTSAALSSIKEELNSGIKEMENALKELPDIKDGYAKLKEGYDNLLKKNEALMEAIKLGFESIPDAVQSGASRKIAIIAENENFAEE